MKKIWKGLILGKTKILSIVFAAVSVVCLTATLALNMTMKPREDTPGGTVVKTEADYQSMGAIDEGYLLFKSCTAADAPDHTTAGLWCIGIDLPAIAAAHSNAWDTYLRNHPALVIPSKVGSDDVVGIDFSGIGYNNPIVSGSHNSGNSFLTAAALIEKVVIPKSVKYITEYSFNSFSKLGYFETPFIGTSRGSSARGINMTLIEVSQWEVLHPNQPTSDSFATMFGKPIPLNSSGIFSPRLNQGDTDYWYTDNSEGIDYSPRQIKWREIDDNQNNSTYFYFNAPDKIDYLKITDETALGNYAMVGCSARHVEITAQGSVFSFGSYTFAESGNLGDALTGQEPSQGLESIELRMSGSISMRVGTFNKCETLKSLILPYVSSSFEIPEGFISSAVNLEQIYIPSTVRSIGNGAFKGCEKLARIAVYSCNGNYLTVDKKLKFTGDFEEDSKLILTVDGVQINKNTVTKFDLPTALETIGVDAFAGCKSFDVIYVPNNVTSIGYGAYDGCTSVKKATLPFVGAHAGRCTSNCTDDIKNSGSSGGKKEQHGLFGWIFGDSSGSTNCYSATQAYVNKDGQLTTKSFFIPSLLTELTIEKETYLYRGAFQGLKSLVSISVNPAVGGNIEIGCFDQCANLVSLTISSIPGNLGALFAGNGSFIEATSTRISNYRVPNTLRNVKVTNMPTAAGALFHNCYTIETVEFSNATTEFGNAIFYNTSNLTSLIVPIVGQLQGKNPYTIYMWWRDVDYRNSLMWLFSFGEQTDHYRNTSQKYYESYAPYIPSKLVSLTVTNESELDYYSLRGFYSLKNISITNIPGNIAEGSFGGCTGLTSLQLPYIGQNINERGYAGRNHVLGWIFGRGNYGNSYAAYQYDTTYYIPNGLEIVEIGTDDRSPSDLSNEIFEHAFKDCKSITTIDFNQARIIGLGSYAFANCTKLEDLHYDNAAYTHVGNYAFYNCKTVKRMKKVGTSEQQKWFIPSTVRTIGNYAFAGTSVGYLDNDVYADNRLDLTSYTSVGAYAFANCLQIDKVVIPENLSFGAGLFANCSYLEEVTLPTHNKVVTPYMFQNCISLPGVDISGISSIPEGLFYGCSRLSQETGLILNQTVNTYGPYCFAKCSSLGHFEFPATEQNVPLRIETGAFQGCTGMDYMTIPQETLVINPYGWIGCDDNFFFYVYDFEEDWPNTWVNNWNCDYPVYVLSDAREDIFTYYYSLTEKKYYITGITKSAYDLGLFDTISIPATHNGLAVVGIDESMMTTEDRAAGAQSITTQAGITRIILPKGVTKIVGEPFKTGQRVDIYTNYTKAEIAKIYADSKAAIDKELNDWAQSQTPKIPEDSLEYANKKTELYQKIKGWVPFGADGDGNCIADGTGLDARNWTSGGILYYKDYWQYAAGTTSPCLNIDTFKYTFDEYALETASYDQGNPVIVPVVKIQLPGEIFVNPSLGVTVDELLYLYDVDILNYKYTNNVNVGTANVTVTVNNDSLDYYNKYINSFGEDYPLKLTGSTTLHFQVLPIEIYLSASANEGLYYTKEYDRNKFTFNQWQTGQMTGLESYPTAVFSGTIATNAADAGFYFAEDMYWSTPWRVTINGVDVTKNFRLTIGFWVEIEKMEVEVVWAKSSQPVNGVYQLAELSGEKKNGKDIYLYPYIGGEITPSAIAKRYGTESDYVPYCQVNVYHISNPGIYTYEKVRDTYHVYARLADEANFILYENVDGEKVVPEVILGATQRVVAVEGWYRVSKGRIVITIDLSGDNAYLISPYENEWSKSWGSEPKGDGTHRPINDRTYITGLGANSRFVGKLATSSDVKSTYNYHSLEDGIRFKAEASPSSYVISWQDISFNYSWDTDQPHSITFTAKEEMPFLVWNPVLGEENENDCYDVVVDARVKINYNEFVPTFFIGLNSGDYPTIKNPTYINRDYTLLPRDVQDENGNIVGTRTYYYWEYAVDGKEYRFSAEDLDVLAKKYPGYQVTYHKGNGTELISEDPTFTQLGDHVFSVTLSARHYDEIQYDIWIKAVRSNVQIGELSKYYDREPVDILDKIIKIGEDQVPNITYIYMDQYGTELHQPPVDAGKYKVRIIVPQGEFFNAFDQVISYEIYPRNITIDVSKPLPGKDFDNLVYTLDLSTLTDLGATSVPGEGLLSGDRLQGIIQTSDFVPAKYYANSSAAYHFVWAADWNVTYLGDYTDVSRNYRVNLVGEYEIRPLQFQYNVRDNLGTLITERDESDHLYKDYIYDSAYHSIKVNVTYPTPTNYYPAPTPKYEVYYSDSPLSEYSSAWSVSCPPCIAPGQHKIYYMIKADYFKTIIDYVVIDIKELPIVYDDPAWNDGDGDDARYTIEYNGSNQTYEIEVIDPKYSATVYYSVNGGRETLEAPMFKEVGEYTVHYRITAPNYEEVNVTVIVHVTEPGEELPTTAFEYNFFSGVYDGNPHSVSGRFLPSFINSQTEGFWYEVTYSVDDGQNWTTVAPSYTEIGKYPVKIKFRSRGYQTLIIPGQIQITGKPMYLETVPVTVVFDGQYHNIGLTTNQSGCSVALDTTTNKFMYTDATGTVELTILYSLDANVAASDSGWIDGPGYKNVGQYPVYAKIVAENYEPVIFTTYTPLEIQFLENPFADMEDQKFEYSKSPIETSQIEIDTVADGVRTAYWYTAHYAPGNIPTQDIPEERISAPQELGLYYVVIKIAPTRNTGAAEVSGFIEIIPRTIHVEWETPQYYDGNIKEPHAKAETGTSDSVSLMYEVIGGVSPIEVGTYDFNVWMATPNPNYVLDTNIITLEILKRSVLFSFKEEMEVKDGYVKWNHTDSVYYDNSEQCPGDDHWHLLGDLQGTAEKYQGTELVEITYSGLSPNHMFYAELETSSGLRGQYFYSTVKNDYYINSVKVLKWDIYEKDENNRIKTIGGVPVSAKDYYDVDFDIVVSIINPRIDLSSLEIITDYVYDGLPHTIYINVPAAKYSGAYVYYKDDSGRYSTVPPRRTFVGEYPVDYYVSAPGFEDTYGSATLKITPADLQIAISDLHKKADPTKTLHEKYDATPHINSYELTNISGPVPDATHMKYYDATEFKEEEIIALYQNFDANSAIYKSGINELVDAGKYYCVVYYEEDINRWHESFAMMYVELKPRDILIEFPIGSIADIRRTYNGDPVVIPLANAIIDTDMHGDDGLLDIHTLNTTPQVQKQYFVQTNSANAGVYPLDTGFEFAAIDIREKVGMKKVKMSNYHPYLIGDFYVEILKKYLEDFEFELLLDEYSKIYDGYVHTPEYFAKDVYTCVSDGELNMTFFEILEDDTEVLCSGNQKNAGKYRVVLGIEEGTNYYSSYDSHAALKSDNTPFLSYATVEYRVNCAQKLVDVIWKDLVQTFNGEVLAPKPIFIDAETDHTQEIEAQLKTIYYDNESRQFIPMNIVNAGSYMVAAVFDESTFVGRTYAKNYILNTRTNMDTFFVNKLTLAIQLGDGGSTNNIIYYSSQAPWSTKLYTKPTPGAAEFVSLGNAEIQKWIDNMTISLGSDDYQDAMVSTIGFEETVYTDSADFVVDIKILNRFGVDVTSSIDFDIIGTVRIVADEIVYELTDTVTVTYRESKDQSGATGYTLAELNCLKVLNPRQYEIAHYKINGELKNVNDRISQAGEYELEFDITATDKIPVHCVVHVTIEKHSAYMIFTGSLNKTYDGATVNISNLINYNLSGFNGNMSDLEFRYVEIDPNAGEIPLTEAPKDAGQYKVYVTSRADSDPNVHKNYTTLEVEQLFKISPKTINLSYDRDLELENDDLLGQPWEDKRSALAGDVVDVVTGDRLVYSISVDPLARGNYYAKKTFTQSNGGAYQDFTSDNHTPFNFSWYVNATDDAGNDRLETIWDGTQYVDIPIDNSKNYTVNLTFKLLVHYPYIPVEFTGVEVEYDGNSYHGTVTFSNDKAGRHDAGWYLDNVIQNYSENAIGIESSSIHTIDDPNITYTEPGEHVVYYYLAVNPAATDMKYEEARGSFIINIKKLTRQITVTPPNKQYDKDPAGHIVTGTTTQRWFPEYEITRDTSIPDVYDMDDVTMSYFSGTTPIDASVGCIEAGTYYFSMEFPETDYYYATVVPRTRFVIDRIKIFIKDASELGGESFVYDNLVKTYDINYNKATQTQYDHDSYSIYVLNEDGDPESIELAGLLLRATLITRNKEVGTYFGSDGSLTLFAYEFEVYDVNDDQDATNNYVVDYAQATVEIQNDEMRWTANSPEYIYDGELHGFSVSFGSPHKSQVTIEYYNEQTGQWQVTPIEYRNVGVHTVDVRFKAKNYNDVTTTLSMEIKRAPTIFNYVSYMGKIYDGAEVTIPTNIQTNRETANEENMRLTYTYEYYVYDSMDSDHAVIKYTQWFTGYDAHGKAQYAFEGTRPIDVGKYMIRITIPEAQNYEEGVYESIFYISKRDAIVNWAGSEFEYDGTPKSPAAYMILTDEDIKNKVVIKLNLIITPSAETTDPEHKSVGFYIAKAEIDYTNSSDKAANYNIDALTEAYPFKITPRHVTVRFAKNGILDLEPHDFNLKHESSTEANPSTKYLFEVTHIVPGHVVKDYLHLNWAGAKVYNTVDDFQWRDYQTDQQLVGNPRIFDDNGNDVTSNYIYDAFNYLFGLTLDANAIERTVLGERVEYDGEAHTFTFEMDEKEKYNILYKYTGTGNNYVNANDLPNGQPEFTEVGFYNVEIQICDKDNNVLVTENTYVEIYRANPNLKPASLDFKLGKVYDGIPVENPQMTYAGIDKNPVTLKYKYYKYNAKDGDYTDELPGAPKEAGMYKLVVEIPETPNYVGTTYSDSSFVFQIKPRKITVVIQDNIHKKLYDGLPWEGTITQADIEGSGDEGLAPNQKFGTQVLHLNAKDVGEYWPKGDDLALFSWNYGQDMCKVYDENGYEVQKNYVLEYKGSVEITQREFAFKFDPLITRYEVGEQYQIMVEIIGTYDENGKVVSDLFVPASSISVKYSMTYNGDFKPEIIQVGGASGRYTIYALIEDTSGNIKTVKPSSYIYLYDDPNGGENGPDEPIPGPNEAEGDPWIEFEKYKVYDGDIYKWPIFKGPNPDSREYMKLEFYDLDYYNDCDNKDIPLDPDKALKNPPINTGDYVFIFDVGPDTTNPADKGKTWKQAFRVKPKYVPIVWSDLLVYTENGKTSLDAPTLPTAYYLNVDGKRIDLQVEDQPGYMEVGTYVVTAEFKSTDTDGLRNYALKKPAAVFEITADRNKKPRPNDAELRDDIDFDKSKEYDGDPYDEPKFTGHNHENRHPDIIYYPWDYYEEFGPDNLDPDKGSTTPPTDAGEYVFVMTIPQDPDDPDQYPEEIVKQGFTITPKGVDVVWSELSHQYDGTEKVAKAVFSKIDDPVGTYSGTCTVQPGYSMIGDKLAVVAKSDDPNYKINNPNANMTITGDTIDEVIIAPGQELKYGDPIILKDTSDDPNYYISKEDYDKDNTIIPIADWSKVFLTDNDGKVYVWKADSLEWVDGNLPYTVKLDYNRDAGTHTVTTALTDKTKYSWKNSGQNDLTEDYEILPIILPNEEWDIEYSYKEIWEYTGEPITPPVTITLVERANPTNRQPLESKYYKLTYENNIEVTDNAIINIQGQGNYSFKDQKTFSIVKQIQILQLIEGSDAQWITAIVNETGKAEIKGEDEGTEKIEHTAPVEENMYLGRLHQETYIEDILKQFVGYDDDPDSFVVKRLAVTPSELASPDIDRHGYIPIDKSEYTTKLFGTGFKVCLVVDKGDGTTQVVDEITGIIHGDVDGNGYVNLGDFSDASDFVENDMKFNQVPLYTYFAGITKRANLYYNLATVSDISDCIEDPENFDFNSFGGRYPKKQQD